VDGDPYIGLKAFSQVATRTVGSHAICNMSLWPPYLDASCRMPLVVIDSPEKGWVEGQARTDWGIQGTRQWPQTARFAGAPPQK
jgi:hypothetical protein